MPIRQSPSGSWQQPKDKPLTEKDVCSVEGCERSSARADRGRRGMCNTHYHRVRAHGDPHKVMEQPKPVIDWLTEHAGYDGFECLVWPFHRMRNGYGLVHRPGNNRMTTASALMCEMSHGPKPTPSHEAAHSCGNGAGGCVNPNHLYWATREQNQSDRVKHGTSNRGEQQHSARLTREDVRTIRSLAGDVMVKDIARRFGIHQSYASQIIARKRWGWLD